MSSNVSIVEATVPENTVYLNVFEPITDTKVKVIMSVCTEIIEKARPDAIYFSFSSPGGSVAAGITLYSFLRGLPVKIIMHNVGSIDSIATAVFVAGDIRFACNHSTFLFHGISMSVNGPTGLTLSQLRESISSLEQDENKIVQILTSRTELSESEIRELFRVGESKPPIFAESKGIIDGVRDLDIPRNGKLISLNIQ